ncbi:MAG: hypothetical protein AAFX50_11655, partial [Acidobacteriota bacterium]
EETASGLEILAVADAEAWSLEVRGSVVQNHRVKGLDLSPSPVEWLGQVGGARLWAEADGSRRLLIYTPRRGDLELQDGDHRLHLDLAAERLPVAFERTDEGWRRSGAASPRSGIRLRWLGTDAAAENGAAGVDAELQRQLQALGYAG